MKKIILLFVLLSFRNLSFSQESKTYTLNIDSRDSLLEVNVLYKKLTRCPSPERTYFWISSNQIMKTQGGYDGRVLHGKYICLFPNKNLKEKGYFRKGIRRGLWTTWYPNGKLKERSVWHHGVRCGRFESYNEQGILVCKAKYSNDQLQGTRIIYKDGKTTEEKKFKHGIEVLPKEKPESVKKETKASTPPSTQATKPKPTMKDRWQKFKSGFKKKSKDDKPAAKPEMAKEKKKDEPKK